MMNVLSKCIAIACLPLASLGAQAQIASLGRCSLEAGGVIEDCRLVYRTFGTLSADRRNAILIPTWFGGHIDDWITFFGPTGMIDTTAYYVVVVQSLGSAPSSAPSNSPALRERDVSVGDMVEAAYRLAHEHLQLPELSAVVGISLGGFQAFEWGVAHPGYVRRVVAIGGTPRQAFYARAIWELIGGAARDGATGRIARDSALATIARLMVLGLSSPASVNRRNPSSYGAYLAGQIRDLHDVDLAEWAMLSRASLRYDVARRFGGNLQNAAGVWTARSMVIVAEADHVVDAPPALEFARLINAETLTLPSIGGHSALFGGSAEKAAVRRWLTPQ